MLSCMNEDCIWLARHGAREDAEDRIGYKLRSGRVIPDHPAAMSRRQTCGAPEAGKIAHIFCSPFLRTVQTAHAVASVESRIAFAWFL